MLHSGGGSTGDPDGQAIQVCGIALVQHKLPSMPSFDAMAIETGRAEDAGLYLSRVNNPAGMEKVYRRWSHFQNTEKIVSDAFPTFVADKPEP